MTKSESVASSTTNPADALPTRSRWSGLFVYGLGLIFLASLFLPALLYPDEEFDLNLFTRYMALALFAISVDLVWGYTGLLSLGQGVFFGLGAYALGYSMILQGTEQRGLDMPDYMMQCRMEKIPEWIAIFKHTWVGIAAAIIVPTTAAFILGGIIFQRRIKGVYFSLFTQAMLLALFVLVSNQRPYTGGVDGLTSLAKFNVLGYTFPNSYYLFFVVTGILVVCFVGLFVLLQGKFGKILTAIRDNENRVMALGYNTAMYKTFAYGLAGLLAGVSGALYVAANRSAGPQFFSIPFSIEVVILVAVGGRGTLVGPIIGTVIVKTAQNYLNDNTTMFSEFLKWIVPEFTGLFGEPVRFTEPAKLWPIWLGSLFIFSVLFMPDGIIGLLKRMANRVAELVRAK